MILKEKGKNTSDGFPDLHPGSISETPNTCPGTPHHWFGRNKGMNGLVPVHVLRTIRWTLYWAMVFWRNCTAGKSANRSRSWEHTSL